VESVEVEAGKYERVEVYADGSEDTVGAQVVVGVYWLDC